MNEAGTKKKMENRFKIINKFKTNYMVVIAVNAIQVF